MTFFKPLILTSLLFLVACNAAPSNGDDQSSSSASSESIVSSAASSRVSEGINNTDLPLSVPDGFVVETFAEDLPGARVLVQDLFGNFWVSQPSQGSVSHIDLQSGEEPLISTPIRNLNNPHGLAIDYENGLDLYIAEEDKIIRARLYSDAPIQTVTSLPAGGRHTSRTIEFGPDGRLYVSIGSTCDVCVEANELHGTIISMNKDGTDQKIVATGLRNSVFFDWSYVDGRMWATDMGRDRLGDDLPPEEINIITEGSHYGWPYCYGDQVRDTTFEPNTAFDCSTTVAPHLTLPAHIAPLGLVFIPEEGWPEEYWYDLIVAEHGSWNSSVPVGYKLIRYPLDAQGNPEGEPVDFVSGFHNGRTALGRPVDMLVQPGGTMYITDDKAGAIYRLSRTSE